MPSTPTDDEDEESEDDDEHDVESWADLEADGELAGAFVQERAGIGLGAIKGRLLVVLLAIVEEDELVDVLEDVYDVWREFSGRVGGSTNPLRVAATFGPAYEPALAF